MTDRRPFRRWQRLLRPGPGFTVMELMITVAILGILSAVVIDAGLREWRREQVNSVVLELAGWLQTVRRVALKGSSCTVTLAPPRVLPDTYVTGDQLAQVSSCGSVQPFRLIGIQADKRFEVRLLHATNDDVTGFTFTPAGTLSPPPPPETPIVITVALTDHPDARRCLRLDGLLGALDVGVPTSASGDDCAVGVGL